MAEERKFDQISLVYDGGIASQGKLHLYEYGRALYAFSRLVAVIEYYRRSGHVAERITKDANVDVIVSVPEKGSFLVDAIIFLASQILPQLQGIPFDAFFSFILELLIPRDSEKDKRIVELAKIRLAEEEQRTKQSKEETRRLEIFADAIKDQALTTRQALDTVRWARATPNAAIGRAEFTQDELMDLEDEQSSRLARQEIIGAHAEQLENISTEDIQKLTSRVRPLIAEVGLPLRKSAKRFGFRVRGDGAKKILELDERGLENINDDSLEGETVTLDVKFKAYDRESGWGKVRVMSSGKIIPFIVTPADRARLVESVAQGLTSKGNTIVAHSYVNRSGVITSLVLTRIT